MKLNKTSTLLMKFYFKKNILKIVAKIGETYLIETADPTDI